jgi:hypothetical protein
MNRSHKVLLLAQVCVLGLTVFAGASADPGVLKVRSIEAESITVKGGLSQGNNSVAITGDGVWASGASGRYVSLTNIGGNDPVLMVKNDPSLIDGADFAVSIRPGERCPTIQFRGQDGKLRFIELPTHQQPAPEK